MPLIKARSGGAGPIWLGVKCKTPADYQSAGVFLLLAPTDILTEEIVAKVSSTR